MVESHFACCHVPQRVECVCLYRGYTCSKGRWHAGEPDLARALQNIPYVVVDHADYVPPGSIPPFPENPRGPQFQSFRAWAHAKDGAWPRWAVGSVCDGYTGQSNEQRKKEQAKGKLAPHGLSQREPPTGSRAKSEVPGGPMNPPVGPDIDRRAPQGHNVGPSSAGPGVRMDLAPERREIEENKEALQRQIPLLDADLQPLLLEEEREKLCRKRMASEEERRRWREESA